MRRWLITILALCLLCGTACAETEYDVQPFALNTDTMLQIAFQSKAAQAQRTVRDNDLSVLYNLPETDGAPFFTYNWYVPVQVALQSIRKRGITAIMSPIFRITWWRQAWQRASSRARKPCSNQRISCPKQDCRITRYSS